MYFAQIEMKNYEKCANYIALFGVLFSRKIQICEMIM